jgi:hypothetical protein
MGMTDKEKAMADAKLAAMQKKGPTAKPAPPPAPMTRSETRTMLGKKAVNNFARTFGMDEPFEDARTTSGYHEPKK